MFKLTNAPFFAHCSLHDISTKIFIEDYDFLNAFYYTCYAKPNKENFKLHFDSRFYVVVSYYLAHPEYLSRRFGIAIADESAQSNKRYQGNQKVF